MPTNPLLQFKNQAAAPAQGNPIFKFAPARPEPVPNPGNFGEGPQGGPPLPVPPTQELPFVKRPTGVQAESYADGVTKWGRQGVFFNARDAANAPAIDRYTSVVTERLLDEAGLSGPLGVSAQVTDELTTALRNQVRGDLMYTWRSVEPEEMEGLQQRAARNLIDRAIQVSDQQILQRRSEILGEAFRARGAGPNAAPLPEESALLEQDRELQLWQKNRGRLARFRSEVRRPEVFQGALKFINSTLNSHEHQRALLSEPEQAQAGLIGEVFRTPDFLNAPEEMAARLRRDLGLPVDGIDEPDRSDPPISVAASTLERDTQDTLAYTLRTAGDVTSTLKFVVNTTGGLIEDYRNSQRFGISAEDAAQMPYIAILSRSNPTLAGQLLDAKARAEVERELGQDPNVTQTQFTREVRRRREQEGAQLIQGLLGADIGLPLTQKAQRAPLDPQQDADSFAVFGQNTFGEAKQILSVLWRDGVDLVRNLTDPVAEATTLGVAEGLRALVNPDVDPEVLRSVLDPRNTPAVWARRLEKDAADGKLDAATVMGVLGNGDRMSSLGFMLSRNRLDAGENFLLQRVRAGLTAAEIASQWDRFTTEVLFGTKGQAFLDTLKREGGAFAALDPFAAVSGGRGLELDPELGSQKSRDAALADLALETRKWFDHGLIPHDAGWTDFLSRPIGAAARWAVNTVVGEARDVIELATENPGDLTAQAAMFWGAGEAIGRVAGPIVNDVLERINRHGTQTQRMAQIWKIQDDLSGAMVMNRRAAEGALDQVRKIRGDSIPKVAARLQVLEDALDTIVQHHRADVDSQLQRTELSVPRDVHQSARTVRREVNRLPEGETLDLATGAGMTTRVLSDVARQRYGLIPRLGQRLRRLTRMYGRENPQWTSVHADRIWTDLKDAIESGNLDALQLEDFTSHLSARQAWKLGHDGAREKINRIVRRAFGDDAPPPEVNRYVNDLIQFFADTKAKFDTHRRLIRDKHETAGAFLDHLDRSWKRRRQRLERSVQELQSIGREPGEALVGTLARTGENLERLARLRDRTTNIHFTEGVKYDGHPLLDEISLDDIRAFAAATDSPDNRFYQRMRKADETEAEFWERLDGLDEVRGREARAEFKQQFAKEYLNAPDIRTTLTVDDVTGRPVSRALRERLDVERTAARHEVARLDKLQQRRAAATKESTIARIDEQIAAAEARLAQFQRLNPDSDEYFQFLASHPEASARGWHTQQLGDDWQKIEGWAAGEASEDLTAIFSRYQDMTDGSPDSAMRALRNFHFTSKIQSAAMKRQVRILLEDYNTWSPNLRRAFDEALELQVKEGDFLPMAELRRRHPNEFRRVPQDRDATLDQMLTDFTEVRHNIVEELIRLKMIPEKDRDMWMAPYSGRVSRHHAARKAIATDDLPPSAGPLGLTGEEFSAKRHTSDHRLLVQRRNGTQEEYLFHDGRRATRFLEKEFGVSKRRKNADGDLEGRTATGDTFHLLTPHTKEALKLHDFAGGGAGAFNGAMNLAEWVATARTSLALDRPGLAWTEAQFKLLDPALRRQYTRIGPDEHRFGPLKNKWVHRDALAMLEDAAGGARLMREWGDEVSHAANNHRRLLESFMGTAGRVGSALLFRAPVQALMSNLVFRNPMTWYANLLSNFAIFGPGAMIGNPFDYFFGAAAREAHGLAQAIVYGKGRLKGESKAAFLRRLQKENPLVADVLRDNVLDDTLAFQFLDTNGDKELREVLFGEDPSGDRVARFAQRGMKQFTNRESFGELLDDLFATPPALKGRIERLDVLEDMEANKWAGLSRVDQESAAGELADLRAFMRTQRGFLAPFRKLLDGAAWLSLGRSATGKRIGRFNDTELFSANLYGSIDNYARVRAYLINRHKGHSHEDSLWHVNTFMQTYSQVPPAFNKMKRSPLGSPIMAFPFEMLRIKANLIAHKPGFYMGQNHFLPVANALSIAASGADPDEVAMEMRGRQGIKSYAEMTQGGLWVGGMYFGTEWANMNQNESRLYGIMSRLDVDDIPYGLSAPVKMVAPFVAGNPATQFALSTLTGRDMRTAGPLEGGIWEAAQRNAGRMTELFAPTLLPGAGKVARSIAARQEAAARDITENGRSILNLFAGVFSGVRITGSPIEKPMEELRDSFTEGTEGQFVGRLMSAVDRFGLLFAGEKSDQHVRREFAIGEDDALRAIIFGAREAVGSDDPGVWETFIDDDMRELEALKSRQRAGEKGLEADVKQAEQAIAERMQVHNWMTGKEDIPASPFAVATRLRRAYDPLTMDRIIKNAPLPVRTFVILRAAQHSQALLDRVAPTIMGDLPRRLSRTGVRAIDESLRRITAEGQVMNLNKDRVDILDEYRKLLLRYLPVAKARDRVDRITDEISRRTLEAALEATE